MADPVIEFKVNKAEYAKLREALAYGMLNLGFAVQANYQGRFQDVGGPLPRPASKPGEAPVVQTGNLRRSAHAVAFFDGRVLEHTPGVAIPDYQFPAGVFGVIVGTNTGYGLHLEVGTSKMAARPALVPAAVEESGQAAAHIERGAARHYGRSGTSVK